MGNIFCNYRFFEEGGLIQAEKITMPTNFYQFFFLSQTCSYSAKRIPERIILDLKQIVPTKKFIEKYLLFFSYLKGYM